MAIYKRGESQFGLAQRAAEQRKQQEEIDMLTEKMSDMGSADEYVPLFVEEAETKRRGRLSSLNAAHQNISIKFLNDSPLGDFPVSGDDLARGENLKKLMEE